MARLFFGPWPLRDHVLFLLLRPSKNTFKSCDSPPGFHNEVTPISHSLPSGELTFCHGKWPIEIVDFPINSMVIFHGKMLVHQRVYPIKSH